MTGTVIAFLAFVIVVAIWVITIGAAYNSGRADGTEEERVREWLNGRNKK